MTRRKIVFIHGLSLKVAHDPFHEIVFRSMRNALQRDRPELVAHFDSAEQETVYYGELNRELLIKNGNYTSDEADKVIASIGESLQREYRRLDRREADDFSPRGYAEQPGGWEVFVNSTLVRMFCGMLGLTWQLEYRYLRTRAPEVLQFWDRTSEYRRTLLERTRAAVLPAVANGDEVIVVSHSMGTLVAHDVFARLKAEELGGHDISAWVTLGSPLGATIAQRNMESWEVAPRRNEETAMLESPADGEATLAAHGQEGIRAFQPKRGAAIVCRWFNIAARNDPIVVDQRIEDDFVAIVKAGLVGMIKDHTEVENLARGFRRPNPHALLGYLFHPAFSSVLADWLSDFTEDQDHRN